jgi:hypothetical protein
MPFFLTPSQANDHSAMIPKHPAKGKEWDEAGEPIDVRKPFDFCHAVIVTEFRASATRTFTLFFRGICASKGKNHPLKNPKSQTNKNQCLFSRAA